MQKKLLLTLTVAALAAALAACGAEQPIHSDASTGDLPTSLTTQTESAAQTSETTETTESASGDAITSLADWDKLNADGAYSDDMRAFFGRFLGENTTGIAEFDTVQISDYRIARREPDDADDINRLLFTFTVDASGLSTLPPGQYETMVEELRDPTMVFLGDDPRDAAYPAAEEVGTQSGELSLPGAEGDPCCMGTEAADSVEVLQGFLREELGDAQVYAYLAANLPRRETARLFRALSEEEKRHARDLAAAIYLITGKPYCPRVCVERPDMGDLCALLREQDI